MDKKKLTLLLVALVIAVGTALGARSLFVGASAPQAAAEPTAKGPKVLVAQRALPVGTIITANSISFQAWPKEMVQDAYFLDGEADMTKLLGTVVRYPVTAGQPVTQGALVAPGDRGFLAAALGPGMRAITIPVSAKTGVAGFVFPGDHVDLVLTQQVKGADSQPLKASETILKNLRVLATDQSTTTEQVDGKSVVRTSSTVTLEVTPRIAEKVTVAETIGQLSLSLRSLADNQSELDRMIASGAVKLPEGASKEEEDKILSRAMNRPVEGPTTYQTGGDVSRFQRSTVPTTREQMAKQMAAAVTRYGRPMMDSPTGPTAPLGPTVRVTRGKNTTVVTVEGTEMGLHTDTRFTKGTSMKSRLTRSLLIAASAAAPLAARMTAGPAHAAPPPSVMRSSGDIVLSIGRGQLVTTGGTMTDVFVANDAVADVEVKSSRQLYVFGKSGGETTVYASNAAGDVVWSANVRVGSNIESIDQMLRLAMPDAKVGVATMGTGTYLLTGTVASPEDAAEAERLVQAFVGGKEANANIVSRLKTATPLQVNLQVRFAEVSRSLVKQLGVNLTTIDGTGGFKFGIGQGRSPASFITTDPNLPLGIGSSVTGFTCDPTQLPNCVVVARPGTNVNQASGGLTTIAGMGRFLGLDILGTLDAGETIGLVSTLAQPNLTALSGETADFLAGGEFPIPLSQGLGATSIEYKKFGVSLAYTPTVLANGRISLRVRPEVSELSSEGAIVLNGFQIPALTVRRTETTVELGSGQSFMIAGLMKNNSQNTIKKTPGAGDLPILGALFRSTQFQKGETELVIIVTPYLVNPVDAKDIKLPTDGYSAPNELQRLLGNMDSDGKSGAQRPGPSAAPEAKNAPAPSVGAAEPVAPGRTSSSKRGAVADLPTPGFNLK